MKRWMFGLLLCKLVPPCQGISVLISSWCLCFIAIDRYRSIVTPMKERFGTEALAEIATQSLIIYTSSHWMRRRVTANHLYKRRCTLQFCGEFNWSQEDHTKLVYGISLLVVQFVIPAIIMSFCYWKILQKVGLMLLIL
ncbi:hypothetical protein OSTOST_19007 [Ostertagia ostertagi]